MQLNINGCIDPYLLSWQGFILKNLQGGAKARQKIFGGGGGGGGGGARVQWAVFNLKGYNSQGGAQSSQGGGGGGRGGGANAPPPPPP